jgi:hypothetical protein
MALKKLHSILFSIVLCINFFSIQPMGTQQISEKSISYHFSHEQVTDFFKTHGNLDLGNGWSAYQEFMSLDIFKKYTANACAEAEKNINIEDNATIKDMLTTSLGYLDDNQLDFSIHINLNATSTLSTQKKNFIDLLSQGISLLLEHSPIEENLPNMALRVEISDKEGFVSISIPDRSKNLNYSEKEDLATDNDFFSEVWELASSDSKALFIASSGAGFVILAGLTFLGYLA